MIYVSFKKLLDMLKTVEIHDPDIASFYLDKPVFLESGEGPDQTFGSNTGNTGKVMTRNFNVVVLLFIQDLGKL